MLTLPQSFEYWILPHLNLERHRLGNLVEQHRRNGALFRIESHVYP
jgi:hypothetical protein